MSTIQGKRSFKARPELEKALVCGCYYCTQIYSPQEIKEWVDNQQTAICPKCGIDAVVAFREEDGSQEDFKKLLDEWYEESFIEPN